MTAFSCTILSCSSFFLLYWSSPSVSSDSSPLPEKKTDTRYFFLLYSAYSALSFSFVPGLSWSAWFSHTQTIFSFACTSICIRSHLPSIVFLHHIFIQFMVSLHRFCASYESAYIGSRLFSFQDSLRRCHRMCASYNSCDQETFWFS